VSTADAGSPRPVLDPQLVDRTDSVLVVVDTQPGFLGGDDLGVDDRARAATALERIRWIASLATLLDIPALVTEEDAGTNGATDPDVLDRLAPTTPVMAKSTFGLAQTPELLALVAGHHRSTIVLVGAETDVCVAQSAIGLAAAGFRTVVVEDATFSPGEMHARGLERLRRTPVELNHTKGLTYEWMGTVEDAALVRHALGPSPFRW
jgi:nicotinamidase-related amidase